MQGARGLAVLLVLAVSTGDNSAPQLGGDRSLGTSWVEVEERGQELKRQLELPKGALHLLSVLNTLGEGGEENHRVFWQSHGEMRDQAAALSPPPQPSCAAMMQLIPLHGMEMLPLHPGGFSLTPPCCSPAWDAQLPSASHLPHAPSGHSLEIRSRK